MKEVWIDVMLRGRFVVQIPYKYCPLFPVDLREIDEKIIRVCPTLKGKPYTIEFSERGRVR